MKAHKQTKKVLAAYKKMLPELRLRWPNPIKKSVRCIHTHLFNPKLTVAWLKKRCLINGESFATLFALYLGFNPKGYILYHRLEASKILLKRKKLTITRVAICIGFRSLSSYSHTFKARTGLTPSKWRRDCTQY